MTDWKAELDELLDIADRRAPPPDHEPIGIHDFIAKVVVPAFEELATELQQRGRDVEIDQGDDDAWIRVATDGHEEFYYRVDVKPYGASKYAFPLVPLSDPQGKEYRAEAHVRDRSLEQDVTNATKEDLIESFLREYRRHLEWHK